MEHAAASSARTAAGTSEAARDGNEPAAVFPYLVFKEFLAALLISIGLLIWALAVNAPLLSEANPGKTENPAKAPWYFVGLQELLVYFDPWIAGVAIPTLIIVGLMTIPYLDTSRSATGRYTLSVRRLAISHFLLGFALWWVLIAIGQFLRGPNWQFYWPWQDWSLTQSAEESLWSFPWWIGLPALVAYFTAGLLVPRWRWPWLYTRLGRTRYAAVMIFTLLMYGVPIKIVLRLLLHVKYVLVTPWFNV
jgi:Cytochrome b(C-terminal)/b6/petD